MLPNDIIHSISPLDARKELFRRGEFGFITEKDGIIHHKQQIALEILTDNETEEFMYGGAAGGSKSWTGCTWIGFMCMIFKDTNWFIGRKELKRITESTLQTFFKVSKEYAFRDQFTYNAQKHFIQFNNGSKIDLLDLRFMPSDPMYERYGSTEYTGGWIEEAPECNFGAFDVLNTRVGRNLNDKYGILGKIFLTANPNKNWAKKEFYDKHKKNQLTEERKFLQAFVTDNPFRESGYEEKLNRIKDKATKARLRDGDWEYDDDPTALCSFDDITAIFDNDHVFPGERFITADVARLGSDKAIILVWEGWVVIDGKVMDISRMTEIQDTINLFRRKYQIAHHKAIADEDGIGGGVVDNCGIKGFTNNARPFMQDAGEDYIKPNYNNLQSQCGYYLADKINDNAIYFKWEIPTGYREEIEEELGQLKTWKADTDGKVFLLPKEKIKDNIGRSPDWRDVLLMRSYFDLDRSESEISVEIYNR